MFKVAAKLLMGNALKLEQGEIKIFNLPVIMMPADIQVHLLKKTVDLFGVEKGLSLIYNSSKEGNKTYCSGLLKNTAARGNELSKLYVDIVTLGGYGTAEIIKFDFEKKVVICRFYNSPIANRYKEIFGSPNFPVDAITLGLFAGSYGTLFNNDYDAIETKCVALGDPYCEFVFAPTEELERIKEKLKLKLY